MGEELKDAEKLSNNTKEESGDKKEEVNGDKVKPKRVVGKEVNRPNQYGRPRQREIPGQGRIYFRRKVCRLCVNKVKDVDYKNVEYLKRFVTERGKILPRRVTGNCAKHQRLLARAIKRARMIDLLPFA